MTGIYKITSPSKRVYIGQSVNIERRFKDYLKTRCKGQLKLYNSFVKYGAENHVFEVLVLCDKKDLNETERYFQDLFDVLGKKGLNLKLTKASDRSAEHSLETRQRISNAKFIQNAIRKGTYKEGMTFTKKEKINTRSVYFKETDEYFKSRIELYRKYSHMFFSYNAMCYDIRNGKNPVIEPERIEFVKLPKDTIQYHRNIDARFVKPMDEYLNKLKDKENGNK